MTSFRLSCKILWLFQSSKSEGRAGKAQEREVRLSQVSCGVIEEECHAGILSMQRTKWVYKTACIITSNGFGCQERGVYLVPWLVVKHSRWHLLSCNSAQHRQHKNSWETSDPQPGWLPRHMPGGRWNFEEALQVKPDFTGLFWAGNHNGTRCPLGRL